MRAAIRARGLSKRFGALAAVDGVDLTVPSASVYGFLGPNGSGKSTTIRMLAGLMTPSAGEIEVLGLRIPEEAEALRRRIGYMTQRFSLFEDLTVHENLEFLAAVQDLPRRSAARRVDALIAKYDFADRRGQLAGTLSGGQKQRLALAGAVIHEPELRRLWLTARVPIRARRAHLYGRAHGPSPLADTSERPPHASRRIDARVISRTYEHEAAEVADLRRRPPAARPTQGPGVPEDALEDIRPRSAAHTPAIR